MPLNAPLWKCSCGIEDPVKYLRYEDRDDNNRLLGAQCKECETEYLAEDFVCRGELDDPEGILLCGQNIELYERLPSVQDTNDTVDRGPVERQLVANPALVEDYQMKAGDHIAWKRLKAYKPIWHHGIVTKVEGITVTVVHYCKNSEGGLAIGEESLDITKQNGELYIIHYDEETLKSNPFNLVVARARSRIGEKEYSLFSNNCEHFATFCKTGSCSCQQIEWFKQQIKRFYKSIKTQLFKGICNGIEMIPKTTKISVGVSEVAELSTKVSNGIAVGIVVFIEGVYFVIDISKAYKQRKDGHSSRLDFAGVVAQRFVEFLGRAAGAGLGGWGGSVGGAALGALIGAPSGPIGIAIGVVVGGLIGGIIGGCLGGAAGHALSVPVGQWAGAMIKPVIGGFDDRALSSEQKSGEKCALQVGDIVKFYRYLLHPFFHGIVMELDCQAREIKVLGLTRFGVIEVTRGLDETTYKVDLTEHKSKIQYKGKEVAERAKSQFGPNPSFGRFRLRRNNSRHFTEWCVFGKKLYQIKDKEN